MATARRYVPRQPADAVLHALVREHLDELVEHARIAYLAPLPRYVVDELRAYLACGDFSRGFLRCHCDGCGHDVLVGFTCKGRGLCPSCTGRRMANGAAHLVDRVLPDVPVRQWVLSLPWDVRRVALARASDAAPA